MAWEKVWRNVHNNIHNPHTKSAIWEMIHLNFRSGHKAQENVNFMVRTNKQHTYNQQVCKTMFFLLRTFKIKNSLKSKYKIVFGSSNQKLVNWVLFIIKKIIFRALFKDFANHVTRLQYHLNKCKIEIVNYDKNHYAKVTLQTTWTDVQSKLHNLQNNKRRVSTERLLKYLICCRSFVCDIIFVLV